MPPKVGRVLGHRQFPNIEEGTGQEERRGVAGENQTQLEKSVDTIAIVAVGMGGVNGA